MRLTTHRYSIPFESMSSIMKSKVETETVTPSNGSSQRIRIQHQNPRHVFSFSFSYPDNRRLTMSAKMCLAIGLLVVCCGAAATSGDDTADKKGSDVIKINVTRELIEQVAEQRQKLLSESQRLQQRGNGGETGAHHHGGDPKSTKPKPKEPTQHNKKSKPVVAAGQKYKTPETRQADSPSSGKKEPCQPLPPALLRQILGAAFNPRYMSIDKPDWDDSSERTGVVKGGQRDQEWPSEPRRKQEAFHVHGGYSRILHDEPIPLQGDEDLPVETVGGRHQSMNAFDQDGGGGEERDDDDVQTGNPRHGHRHRHGEGHQRARVKTSTVKSSLHNRTVAKSNSDELSQAQRQAAYAQFKAMPFEQVDQSPDQQNDAPSAPTSGSEKFLNLVRNKRTVKSGFPWSCESKIEWIDLGPNHFPRFLRSVVCTSDRCWFGHFQCRPKAFTVKILRRRKDSCEPDAKAADQQDAPSPSELNDEASPLRPDDEELFDFNSRVPHEFREQWVFEERAVTFCCECAA